jgi:UDP-N-acetylmuramate: L-alanyl-gamma-D-glutamyl-meso-diaminopimelate ligase
MSFGIRTVHFSGICGTAMASVAVALKERGFTVTGSDQAAYPPMCTFLEEQGIEVRSGYAESNLSPTPDLVVIGNALSRGNPEVEAVLDRKLRYLSLPELLREFFLRGKRCVVVTGTHGKTTTAAMLAWVLEHNGLAPSFLIGGVPANFGRGCRVTDSEWFVLEGDEYDTAFFDKRSKFVHYLPEIGIVNNVEFDHADIFADLAAVQRSFSHFIRLIPRNGMLMANGDDANLSPLLESAPCPVMRFGLGDGNALRAVPAGDSEAESAFRVGESKFRFGLAGEHNLRNALGVVAVARQCGLSDPQIQAGFDGFEGVKRRLEIRGVVRGVTVIDDFAHHPTAIRETLKGLRTRYPGRRVWALFEPRSNSTRRRVFQAALADALSGADWVVVARVARLELLPPEDRLDPELLIRDVRDRGREAAYLPDALRIVEHLVPRAKEGDVVCVFSNGGFGGIHGLLLEQLAIHRTDTGSLNHQTS